jgi:hypothetical protein
VVYGEKLLDKGDFKSFAAMLEERGWNVVGGGQPETTMWLLQPCP